MSIQKVAAVVFLSAVIVVLSIGLLSPSAREGHPKIGLAGAVGAPGWVLLTAGLVAAAVLLIGVIFAKPKKWRFALRLSSPLLLSRG